MNPFLKCTSIEEVREQFIIEYEWLEKGSRMTITTPGRQPALQYSHSFNSRYNLLVEYAVNQIEAIDADLKIKFTQSLKTRKAQSWLKAIIRNFWKFPYFGTREKKSLKRSPTCFRSF